MHISPKKTVYVLAAGLRSFSAEAQNSKTKASRFQVDEVVENSDVMTLACKCDCCRLVLVFYNFIGTPEMAAATLRGLEVNRVTRSVECRTRLCMNKLI